MPGERFGQGGVGQVGTLTAPVGDAAVGPAVGESVLLGSDPRVRALGCRPEYVAHQARTTCRMPVLRAVAGALTACAGQEEAVATAVEVRLLALHRYAPTSAAEHRAALYRLPQGRPSPAASWLRWGPQPSPA
ncbi:hypothetical protein ACFV5G_33470 [Streptomyces sp. NPDC059766]|uniref:hypothetical protein n=1 Tax=Streptomyces sp. NPDC059766 TaxID=3346940 RepID=UPI0036518D9C